MTFSWVTDPQFVVLQFLTGLSSGMLIFIVASGLTLIFSVARVLNLLHGSLYMVALYLVFTVIGIFAGSQLGFWIALLIVPVITAAIGGFIEYLSLRPMYHRELHYYLLSMFGILLIIGDLLKLIFGPEYRDVAKPNILAGSVSLWGQPFPTYSLFVIGLGVLVAFGLWFVFYKTKLGAVVRGTASDPEMMNALGVNVPSLLTLVFMAGCWLAGLGGAVAAGMFRVGLGVDLETTIVSLIVVVIGGMGSIIGALVGSLMIAQVDAFGILILPRFAMVFTYVLMVVIFLIRPWGLFGKPEIWK